MQTVASVLRVILILECILGMPLLVKRMSATWEAAIPVIWGLFFLYLGLILGSWQALHAPFRIGQILTVIGVMVVNVAFLVNTLRQKGRPPLKNPDQNTRRPSPGSRAG